MFTMKRCSLIRGVHYERFHCIEIVRHREFNTRQSYDSDGRFNRFRNVLCITPAPLLVLVTNLSDHMWSSVAQLVECRTRNRESPGSNPVVTVSKIGHFLSLHDASVDSAVYYK